MLTLDLVAEEDSCSLDDDADSSFQVDRCDGHQDVGGRRRADTDASKLRTMPKESKVKTGSLPRGSGWYCSKSSQLDVCRAQKNQQVQVRTHHQPNQNFRPPTSTCFSPSGPSGSVSDASAREEVQCRSGSQSLCLHGRGSVFQVPMWSHGHKDARLTC